MIEDEVDVVEESIKFFRISGTPKAIPKTRRLPNIPNIKGIKILFPIPSLLFDESSKFL